MSVLAAIKGGSWLSSSVGARVAGAQNEVGKALKLFFSAFDSTVASAVILSSPL